jgi:NAD(P)-dependent dehydrogenase (short-subunit alcohol dehydrogenase family)/rhamnose utilization protein RhaD (predicted bifunctional aldolase and dehydrogenase)
MSENTNNADSKNTPLGGWGVDYNKHVDSKKSPLGDLGVLCELSRFYGSNKSFVIAGGGNTSYKTEDKLWVKASGFALSSITEEGFSVLDRKKLSRISESEYSDNPFAREHQIKADLAAAAISKDKRQDINALLHHAIDYKFVVHLHPTLVNGVLCSNDVEMYIESLFGADALYIPFTDPGYPLFKEVEAKIKEFNLKKGFDPKVILPQNHGIIVSANTKQEVIGIFDTIISNIEKALKLPIPTETIEIDTKVTEIVPAIRAIVSAECLKTLKVKNSALIRHFTNDEASFKKISRPFTPDGISCFRSKYIYLSRVKTVQQTINQFQSEYEEFVSENGFEPKVVLIKGIGLVTIGDNAFQSEIISESFIDSLKIAWLTESFGGQHFLTSDQIENIEVLEKENIQEKYLHRRVENKICIVTGAAQGFGEGIARIMKENGANIVVADLNEAAGIDTAESFNQINNNSRALFVKTNVAEMDSLNKLIYETVCEFGGVDVFVSNAGILRAGGLDEMTPENFDLVTKINYNAYFYCVKAVAPVMKLQHKYNPELYADVIQINSKSGLAGSKKNFAYSGGKFGGIGLTQSFALELAPDRIKVNSICPGNFYEGPLWSDPVNGLFVQYLNTGKVPGAKTIDDVKAFYLAQVPLGKGCSPADVAKAVFYAIDQENETGQAIPVSGGQIMLS